MKSLLIRLVAVIVVLFAFTTVSVLAQADPSAPRVWLSSEVQTVTAGQQFAVNVNVSEAVGVYGGSFKLKYDPQALEAVLTDDGLAVTSGTFFGTQPSFTLTNRAAEGVAEYALTLTQPAEPVSGEGVLGVLTFRALQDSTVNLTLEEARLLSPEFSETDGHKVARKINEVQTQVEGLTVTVSGGSAPAVQPVVTVAPQLQPTSAPVILSRPAPIRRPLNVNTVLIIGGGLFIVGLALFAASLGTYVKMRRQFTLVEQESGLW